jgi:hypothetical protein
MALRAIYPPLSEETRETVLTDAAAFYLQLKAKTLRDKWAGEGAGPIQPLRVAGRLHWKTADLRRLLGMEVAK